VALIYPILNEEQLSRLESSAEANIYRALRDSLDDHYIVIHSRSFIVQRADGSRRDGEADFVVFSEHSGILAIEVKGGGIRHDPQVGWTSIDRYQKEHRIKDPIIQAKGEKFAVLEELKSCRSWTSLRKRVALGHAVFFPDIDTSRNAFGSACPDEILGGRQDLNSIQSWLKQVFSYWDGADTVPLGTEGLRAIESFYGRPSEVLPLLRDTLSDVDTERIRLTEEQASVLRTLGRQKRAAIAGPAGTGKTVLAVQKARMLAEQGAKVLLLCYNKPLGVMLSKQFAGEEMVTASSFHQFCEWCTRCVKEKCGMDVKAQADLETAEDYFDIRLPLAAFYAIEALEELRYDAVIIDEGQDFGDEYWLPLDMVLKSTQDSWLYIFYDENQRLYSRTSSFPIQDGEIFPLYKNCRNTKPIHEMAYRYYDGDVIEGSGLDGRLPEVIQANSDNEQGKLIARKISQLIHDEMVAPEDIGVLVCGSPKASFYEILERVTLPGGAMWAIEEHFANKGVVVDTVKRFKGLERQIIFLWLDEEAAAEDALMYVGISRAKSVLYIVGAPDNVESFVNPG